MAEAHNADVAAKPADAEGATGAVFFGFVSALLFVACALATFLGCRSMGGGMSMPGGWTMSMAFMRMPGENWLVAFASFLALWVTMMVAMMLPCVYTAFARYRRATRAASEVRAFARTAVVAAGYFSVWTLIGVLLYPVGVLASIAVMRWGGLARLVPLSSGLVLLLTGVAEMSGWKARTLERCRRMASCPSPDATSPGAAWRHGLNLGLCCSLCCAGVMTALLVVGVMDLAAMAVATSVLVAERLLPWPRHVTRLTGTVLTAAGFAALALALGRIGTGS